MLHRQFLTDRRETGTVGRAQGGTRGSNITGFPHTSPWMYTAREKNGRHTGYTTWLRFKGSTKNFLGTRTNTRSSPIKGYEGGGRKGKPSGVGGGGRLLWNEEVPRAGRQERSGRGCPLDPDPP